MHSWEAIQTALDYVEDNIKEVVKIETAANFSGLSPFYFQRLFRRLVGKTFAEYVKLRKLARGSDELRDKSRRIIEIASDYGFSGHANFTRAFKKTYGITPKEYRDSGISLNHFIKPDLILDHSAAEYDTPFIADGIVVEVCMRKLDHTIHLIGIEKNLSIKELGGGKITGVAKTAEIWDSFHRKKRGITNLLADETEIGVFFENGKQNGELKYFAGAKTVENIYAAEFSAFSVPAGEYSVCSFEAENFKELTGSSIFKAFKFMSEWLKDREIVCGDFSLEKYFDSSPDASRMEIWFPVIPSENGREITEKWNNLDRTVKPSMNTVGSFVGNALWAELCACIEEKYQARPVLEYSSCSWQPGWNVKYRKSGRSLCTLYPMKGSFTALVVISERERCETEMMLPLFSEKLREAYASAKEGNGQKWLMVDVDNSQVLEDVKKLIEIRKGRKRKKGG